MNWACRLSGGCSEHSKEEHTVLMIPVDFQHVVGEGPARARMAGVEQDGGVEEQGRGAADTAGRESGWRRGGARFDLPNTRSLFAGFG